jgi:hypothetical protein
MMTKVGFFGKWQEFRAIGKTRRTDFDLVVLFIKNKQRPYRFLRKACCLF